MPSSESTPLLEQLQNRGSRLVMVKAAKCVFEEGSDGALEVHSSSDLGNTLSASAIRKTLQIGIEDDNSMAATVRGHVVAATGELIGTTLFLFYAFAAHLTAATQAGETVDKGLSSQTIVYISLGYGFSLLVNAWIFYRVCGGLFNPAVTLALVTTNQLPWIRGVVLLPAQMLGGILAAVLANALLSAPISLVNTSPAPGTNSTQAFFIEMLLTVELLLAVLMLAAEKSRATYLAPVGIGLALFVAEIAGINYTGASLNPARSFGPAVVSGDFGKAHWVYWAGPLAGAVATALFYGYLKGLKYETANPGQDTHGEEQAIGTERVPV